MISQTSQNVLASLRAQTELVGTPDRPGAVCAGKTVLVSGSIGAELCRQVLSCGPATLILYELNEYALYTVDMALRTQAEQAGVVLVPVLGSVTDGALAALYALQFHGVGLGQAAASERPVEQAVCAPSVPYTPPPSSGRALD